MLVPVQEERSGEVEKRAVRVYWGGKGAGVESVEALSRCSTNLQRTKPWVVFGRGS